MSGSSASKDMADLSYRLPDGSTTLARDGMIAAIATSPDEMIDGTTGEMIAETIDGTLAETIVGMTDGMTVETGVTSGRTKHEGYHEIEMPEAQGTHHHERLYGQRVRRGGRLGRQGLRWLRLPMGTVRRSGTPPRKRASHPNQKCGMPTGREIG